MTDFATLHYETEILVLFEQNPNKPYGIKDVSNQTNIPDDYVYQILKRLEHRKFLTKTQIMIKENQPLAKWLHCNQSNYTQGPPRFVQQSSHFNILNDFKADLKPFDSSLTRRNCGPINNYNRYGNYDNFQIGIPNNPKSNLMHKPFLQDDFYVHDYFQFRNNQHKFKTSKKWRVHTNPPDVSKPRSKFDDFINKPVPTKNLNNKNTNNNQNSKPSNIKSTPACQNNTNATSAPTKTSVISMDIVNGNGKAILKHPSNTLVKSALNIQKPTPNKPGQTKAVLQSDSDKNLNDMKDQQKKNTNNNNKSSSKKVGYDLMDALTKNPVAVLHEYAQKNGLTCELNVLNIAGPPHKPRITVGAKLNGKCYEPVVFTNKKEAKRNAAELVIRQLISEGSIKSDQQDPNLSVQMLRKSTGAIINRSHSMTSIPVNNEKSSEYQPHQNNIVPTIDSVASLNYTVQTKIAELIANLSSFSSLNLAGRKVVSALVLENVVTKGFEVVCMATGNKCITGDKISLQGTVVHDSHAEIVVRRCFLYFLYQQIQAQFSHSPNSMDLFENISLSTENICKPHQLKLKSHFKVHLYISTAPCGDSALFSTKDNSTSSSVMQPIVIGSDAHEPVYETSNQGQLRCKIESGEGTIPLPPSRDPRQFQTLDGILRGERLKTMSCSDKIARWNFLGLQGSLLSQILAEPIYLESVMLGNLFQPGHLSRGVCCRLVKRSNNNNYFINHPHLMYTGNSDSQFSREIDKANEHSINWIRGINPLQNHADVEILDGITGLPNIRFDQQTNMAYSRISKASLFHEYFKTQKIVNPEITNFELSYREIKDLSRGYNTKRKEMFQKFFNNRFGSWISKPAELTMFKNSFCV